MAFIAICGAFMVNILYLNIGSGSRYQPATVDHVEIPLTRQLDLYEHVARGILILVGLCELNWILKKRESIPEYPDPSFSRSQ